MTEEEKLIIEEWRRLGNWGELRVTKQNGKLFAIHTTEEKRIITFAKKRDSMV